MESLSREDLVKYIKKQGVLLQKSKTRCEGRGALFFSKNDKNSLSLFSLPSALTKECDKLKESSVSVKAARDEEIVLREELMVVRSERDAAVRKEKELQKTVTGLERDNQVRKCFHLVALGSTW